LACKETEKGTRGATGATHGRPDIVKKRGDPVKLDGMEWKGGGGHQWAET
jgi:hypothetical protein